MPLTNVVVLTTIERPVYPPHTVSLRRGRSGPVLRCDECGLLLVLRDRQLRDQELVAVHRALDDAHRREHGS